MNPIVLLVIMILVTVVIAFFAAVSAFGTAELKRKLHIP